MCIRDRSSHSQSMHVFAGPEARMHENCASSAPRHSSERTCVPQPAAPPARDTPTPLALLQGRPQHVPTQHGVGPPPTSTWQEVGNMASSASSCHSLSRSLESEEPQHSLLVLSPRSTVATRSVMSLQTIHKTYTPTAAQSRPNKCVQVVQCWNCCGLVNSRAELLVVRSAYGGRTPAVQTA